MADPRRHLNVEIELDAHSLSGTVADEGEGAQQFASWLELMNAVEVRRPAAPARKPNNEIEESP